MKRRLDIDLLRFLAITLVVVAHTMNISIGAIGVQVFFLVSGYLLADYKNRFGRVDFIIYRFSRLFPLSFLMSLIFYFRFDSPIWFLANILMVQTLFSNFDSYPGGWSISFEWIFSLIIATGLITKSRIFRLVILTGSLLLQVYLYIIEKGIFDSFPYTILSILANLFFITLGISFRNGDFRALNRWRNISLIPLIYLLLVTPKHSPFPLFHWSIMVFCLGILLLDNKTIMRFSDHPQFSLLHRVGTYTYGIFCAHFIVMIGLTNILIDGNSFAYWLKFTYANFGLFVHFFIVFLISYFMAKFSYKYLERPIVSYVGRKLSKI
ncbi:MAG: hypothetical protein RL193_1196 [Actinomycetota bacterium]|jgi:peptidoglycan/LPS O-acetylase OafA/YrhL